MSIIKQTELEKNLDNLTTLAFINYIKSGDGATATATGGCGAYTCLRFPNEGLKETLTYLCHGDILDAYLRKHKLHYNVTLSFNPNLDAYTSANGKITLVSDTKIQI